MDGKLRYDGVRSFLRSRSIDLPWGDPDDPADRETVCGLGNRKNELIGELLDTEGVDVFESVHCIRTAAPPPRICDGGRLSEQEL